jgi:hypothetical protein
MSARRLADGNGDQVRFEGSNGMNARTNRWPTLTTTQIANGRLAAVDDKARRSQVSIGLRNVIPVPFILIYSKSTEVFMKQVGYT